MFSLCIVVVFFNKFSRLNATYATIHELLNNKNHSIDLVIVDNSGTLNPLDFPGSLVIRGGNLCGCSGGFMRGLLHAKDAGKFTHCLFLDDDTTFDAKSIVSAMEILSDPTLPENAAVSATFFTELQPNLIHEMGGKATFPWSSRCRGVAPDDEGQLLHEIQRSGPADYGAFWFFMFPLKYATKLWYPMYLRGEDVMFGVRNQFQVITSSKVRCIGPDFRIKEDALSRYYDTRSQLALVLMGVLQSDKHTACAVLSDLFIHELRGRNYATARAISEALRDVSNGPDFWLDYMDTSSIRERILNYSLSEKKVELIQSNLENVEPHDEIVLSSSSPTQRLFAKITFWGLLLPNFLSKKSPVHVTDCDSIKWKRLFRYKTILYSFDHGRLGYRANISLFKYVVEKTKFSIRFLLFRYRYHKLQNSYIESMEIMASEAFWRNLLK
jgi:hypothetical protein